MLSGCGRPSAHVRGIGVSVPGSVDPIRGAMVNSIVLPSWDGVVLAPLFLRDLDVPGELGHIPICDGTGVLCRCGQTDCLEAVAGGWGHRQGAAVTRPRRAPRTRRRRHRPERRP